MSTAVSASLKRVVIQRANYCCEYCGKPAISFYPHEVDHVTAQKHGGPTTLANLAYSYFDCNRHKGTDLTSIDPETGQIIPLFNPRTQLWPDHFSFEEGRIVPKTAEGHVTVFLLHLNDPERVMERVALKIGLE
jgi:hypothetical protein